MDSEFSATAFDVEAIEAEKRRKPTAAAEPRRKTGDERLARDCLAAVDDNRWFQELLRKLEFDMAHLADLPDLSLKQMGELSYAHRMIRSIQRDYKRSLKHMES